MTYNLTELPKRPHENFTDFLHKLRNRSKKKHEFPCDKCEGSGRIPEPDYPFDVVEGYKGRGTIMCSQCGGKGEVAEKILRAVYDSEIKEWRKKCARLHPRLRREKEVLKKVEKLLTQEELEVLGRII